MDVGDAGDEAGVMSGVALTALRGLDDTLGVRLGESVAIVGASGGVGHVAVQLAKLMGARVLGVASGADGVELVEGLGADAAVDGRTDDVPAAARRFAPRGGSGVRISGYNGDPEIIGRLEGLIEQGHFRAHIARTFPLEEAADAHRALGDHYLGKLALRTR